MIPARDASAPSRSCRRSSRTSSRGSSAATSRSTTRLRSSGGEATVGVHGEEVAWLGSGESFGEVALIDRRPRTATVTAKTDLVTYALPVFVFRPFVEARPVVAWKLLEAMADRLEAAESR